MLPFTLDDYARLSEEAAAQRAFDRHNALALRWYLRVFTAVVFSNVIIGAKGRDPWTIAAAVANLVLILVLMRLLRRITAEDRPALKTRLRLLDGLEAPLTRHIRSITLTWLIAQILLMVFFFRRNEGGGVWLTIYPFILIAFRFVAAETILLYGSLLIIGVLAALLQAYFNLTEGPPLIAVTMCILSGMVASLYLSRRRRQAFLGGWTKMRDEARERIRMRDELAFAREVQLAMLPVEMPKSDWLEIVATSVPASEVGGDYFGFFPIDDDRLAIVVADVAGHGLASGMVLSGVRSCLTLLSEELSSPAVVMRRMHRMVQQTARHRMLVTMALVLLDRRAMTATVTSAGHPPVALRRADGSVELIEFHSLPLGAGLPVEFPERVVPLAPGDMLVLHTDGVYEASDIQDRQYGLERLAGVIGQPESADGGVLLQAIGGDVRSFRGARAQEDDATVVVVTVRPGPLTSGSA